MSVLRNTRCNFLAIFADTCHKHWYFTYFNQALQGSIRILPIKFESAFPADTTPAPASQALAALENPRRPGRCGSGETISVDVERKRGSLGVIGPRPCPGVNRGRPWAGRREEARKKREKEPAAPENLVLLFNVAHDIFWTKFNNFESTTDTNECFR